MNYIHVFVQRAGCYYSGNNIHGNQSKNITEHQKNLADKENYSSWSVEPTSVTFDLGNEVWDDFDDDSLLVDNSFLTSVETPILGKTRFFKIVFNIFARSIEYKMMRVLMKNLEVFCIVK